ncbi:MAG: protease inhibitor I42 family protein [Cyanobacteriota bacterium]|nr:protease inhibitor I42 family protein [Cyanobacteriota bacterium]
MTRDPMDFVLTAADNGASLHLSPGSTGELRLPETPTTGYRWTLDSAPSNLVIGEGVFTASGEGTLPPPQSALGGSGERRWVIQAKTAGRATLTLQRWRDWEGESSVVERYGVTLTISP